MAPGTQFPIPPFTWPQVGRQWPTWNIESDQADGLVLWMPWGGGTVPGGHSYVDQISGLAFTKGGTPVWIADSERGWSVLFDDGSTESLVSTTTPVTAAPITMACWFRSDDIAARNSLIGIGNSGDWEEFFLLQARGDVAGDPVQALIWSSGAVQASTTTGFSANVWHHACAVFAADDDRAAYIDGGSKGTESTTKTPSGVNRITIGVSPDSTPAWYMSGCITDGRIYNIAKTDTEVYQMRVKPWELHQIPRRLWRLGVVAPPATIVPVAMHHYRSMRI